MSEIVASVTNALGVRLVGQCAGGEFGAFRILLPSGAAAVLKLLPPWPALSLSKVQTAAGLVGLLVESGYPAPRFFDVGTIEGTVYTVQEFVEGELSVGLPTGTAGALLRLLRRQADVLPPGAGAGWAAELIDGARRGAELRSKTNDSRVHAVLDRVAEIAKTVDLTVFRTTDVVHGDFHPGNLLFQNEDIAAVIDWESALAGDSRADLLRMYAVVATWSDPDSVALESFRRELEATTPPEARLPMAAALAVHHLRYGLFARPDELDWVLREAQILLFSED
jgi:aminoglycoside phosphotransferase (APT) family kinase protein